MSHGLLFAVAGACLALSDGFSVSGGPPMVPVAPSLRVPAFSSRIGGERGSTLSTGPSVYSCSGGGVLRPLSRAGFRAGVLGTRCAASPSADIREKINFYNTLSRDKQAFVPEEDGKVKMYTCGPTVYDFAHIGNFRAFLTYDLIKRWLLYCGFDVDHVCNLTDIDDKIIQRMKRDNISLKDLTNKYADAFLSDLSKLNIIPAGKYPRATEHIDDIVTMIQGLVDKGHAYESKGSFYFDVETFADYGKLARLDFDNMRDGAGEGGGITDPESFEKKGARDFALWKAYKEDDGEVFWETGLGKGRPGWHIECSAMSKRFLGNSIDIHAGGVDLTFPHHENEIAQSECFCGCEMSKFWMHNGFVNINNEKMSKSLGNFLTIRDVLKTAEECRAFRYLVISSSYRQSLNFAPEVLKGAKNTIKRLDKWRARLVEAASEPGDGEATEAVKKAAEASIAQFEIAMNDDLNTPRACAALFTFLKKTEKGEISKGDAALALEVADKFDKVIGVFYDVPGYDKEPEGGDSSGGAEAPAELLEMLAKRNEAKEAKDWAKADEIRDAIKAQGFVIKDVKGGPSQLVKA